MSDDDSGLAKFASDAFRGPKMDTFERLAVIRLLAATRAPPLKRIRLVCDVYWLLDNNAQIPDASKARVKALYADDVKAQVKALYAVATSLSSANPVTVPQTYQTTSYQYVPVPWSFPATPESFDTYIKAWWNGGLNYYRHLLAAECLETWAGIKCGSCEKYIYIARWIDLKTKTREELEQVYEQPPPKKCPHCDWSVQWGSIKLDHLGDRWRGYKPEVVTERRIKVGLAPWIYFFDGTDCLRTEGLRALVNNFLAWASPQVARLEAQLSGLIKPQSFVDVFREMEVNEDADRVDAGPRNDQL